MFGILVAHTLVATSGSFKWIVRHEGVPGLYRGLVPALFLTSHGMVQVRPVACRRVAMLALTMRWRHTVRSVRRVEALDKPPW